jgi:alkylhydroperoxidase family enzyme
VPVSLAAARRESTVFPDAEHAAGVSLIALINVINRLTVITGQPGGNHHPDQFG